MFGDEFPEAGDVAHGAVGELELLEAGQGPDFGIGNATSAEPVEFAAFSAEFVVAGVDGFELAGGDRGKFFLEESDVDGDAGLAILGEEFRPGDFGDVARGADEGINGVAKRRFEMAGNAGFERGGVGGIGGEDDVAAGDKSFDVTKPEGGEESFEFGHGEAAFAEIHAAQERDVAEGWHQLRVGGQAADDNGGTKPASGIRQPYSIDLLAGIRMLGTTEST